MSSTLRVTNVSDVAGGTSTNLMSGLAKAWSRWNFSTSNIDFNVSSHTDNGTGDVTVNFSSNMSSTSYVVTGGTSLSSVTTTQSNIAVNSTTPPTVSAASLYSTYVNATQNRTNWDQNYCMSSFNGDLA